ncbi:MAG: putative molybdenum carrier protein [Myxococcales bacterium]|nr:putative molybdenum carrier protein [Myxococcales bacterium]
MGAPLKIVSGGQTGVDRAALDAALAAGLACGGWCPRGRWAEDGPIAQRYPLDETPETAPAQRTAWNARDSDATLVVSRGAPAGGSALAIERARAEGRPVMVLDLATESDVRAVERWLDRCGARVLNVAGPRESEAPGIYEQALHLLTALIEQLPRGD